MQGEREEREREFEDLLVEVLSQDYDLAVRHPADTVDRRRRGTATLEFDYHYSGPDQAKVLVHIRDAPEFTNLLPVDFSSPEAIQSSAEDCEALALFLIEHLSEQREELFAAAASGDMDYGRRDDDLL